MSKKELSEQEKFISRQFPDIPDPKELSLFLTGDNVMHGINKNGEMVYRKLYSVSDLGMLKKMLNKHPSDRYGYLSYLKKDTKTYFNKCLNIIFRSSSPNKEYFMRRLFSGVDQSDFFNIRRLLKKYEKEKIYVGLASLRLDIKKYYSTFFKSLNMEKNLTFDPDFSLHHNDGINAKFKMILASDGFRLAYWRRNSIAYTNWILKLIKKYGLENRSVMKDMPYLERKINRKTTNNIKSWSSLNKDQTLKRLNTWKIDIIYTYNRLDYKSKKKLKKPLARWYDKLFFYKNIVEALPEDNYKKVNEASNIKPLYKKVRSLGVKNEKKFYSMLSILFKQIKLISQDISNYERFIEGDKKVNEFYDFDHKKYSEGYKKSVSEDQVSF